MRGVREWLEEAFIPIVITSTSQEAERICQKNGLTFTELISPFSFLEGANAPIRTVNHQITLADVKIRFLPGSELSTPPVEAGDEAIADAVSRHQPPDNLLNYPRIHDSKDVEQALKYMDADPFPWFTAFRTELMESLRCQEHEMFHCPAAQICVVSTTDQQVVAHFQHLSADQNLPRAFHQGQYDPNIPRFFVLLHDNVEAAHVDPAVVLSQMRGSFAPSTCKLVRINSLHPQNPDRQQYDFWSSHPHVRKLFFANAIPHRFPAVDPRLGCLLSPQDLDELRNFVWDLTLRGVIPALESRLHNLNASVSAVRKGLKNQLRSWWRKPKDAGTQTTTTVLYRYDSIESQIRLLGDTAFILRDYEFAQQMYRLVREDFKSDKALAHFASANEMIAVSLFMGNGNKRDISSFLEISLNSYGRAVSQSRGLARLATKSTVIASEIFRTLANSATYAGFMNDASIVLLRASTAEQSLIAALLLERAAFCDLQNDPSFFRKYAFHLVMAGHMYHTCNQDRHAVRCYAAAVGVYEGHGWVNIDDHIHFTLARQLFALGDPPAAIRFFLKLVGSGRQQQQQQTTFLKEFLYVVRTFQQMEPQKDQYVVEELCLPKIDDSSVKVYIRENASDAHPVLVADASNADIQEDKEWSSMETALEDEEAVHDKASKGLMSWFEPPPDARIRARAAKKRAAAKMTRSIVGEDIFVDVEFHNPLAVAVEVNQTHLYGSLQLESGESLSSLSSDVLDVATELVILQPGARQSARLRARPKAPGKLVIQGLRWQLFSQVWGSHEFNLKGPLLQDTREHRATGARGINTTLVFQVTPPMPWLGVKLSSIPDTLLSGEVRCLRLELHNKGQAVVKSLRVKSNIPVVCIGSKDDIAYESQKPFEAAKAMSPTIGPTGSLISLSHIELSAGEIVSLPLWVRGVGHDKQTLRFLFRYSNEAQAQSKESERSIRVTFQVNVKPSVTVSAFVRPSYDHCGDYVLGVTLTNCRADRDNDRSIRLHQITSVSKHWQIDCCSSNQNEGKPEGALSDAGHHSDISLKWKESCTLYFKLRAVAKDGTHGRLKYSNLALNSDASQSHRISVRDSCSSPMINFLCLEQAAAMMQFFKQKRREEQRKQNSGAAPKSIASVRRENQRMNSANAGNTSKPIDPPPTDPQALTINNSELHLALAWSTEVVRSGADSRGSSEIQGTMVYGQHFVRAVTVRPQLNSRYCPLTINVNHPKRIEFPFGGDGGICQVPVTVVVRNGSAPSSAPITFTFETLHANEARNGNTKEAAAPMPRISWAGTTRKRIINLRPGEVEELQLIAGFIAPGHYNLNRFRFVVDSSSGKQQNAVVFVFPTQYLVLVQNQISITRPARRASSSVNLSNVASPRHGEEKFGTFKHTVLHEEASRTSGDLDTEKGSEGPDPAMDAVELGPPPPSEGAESAENPYKGDQEAQISNPSGTDSYPMGTPQEEGEDSNAEQQESAWNQGSHAEHSEGYQRESIVTDEITSPVLDDNIILNTTIADYIQDDGERKLAGGDPEQPLEQSPKEAGESHLPFEEDLLQSSASAKPSIPMAAEVLFTADSPQVQGAQSSGPGGSNEDKV